MKNLISIIIPVFNAEKYLPELFECLSRITYKHFEVIFINDNSTDNSKKLIENFCLKFNNTRLINHKTNFGVSASRNTGIKNAVGDFVYFIDADDLFNPIIFDTYICNLTEHDADITTSKNLSFDKIEMSSVYQNKTIKKSKIINNHDKIIASFLTTNFKSCISPLTCWGKILKFSIIKKMDNFPNVFNPKLRFCEDVVFMYNYLLLSKKMVCFDEIHYFHREHANSIIHSCFDDAWFDQIRFFDYIDVEKNKQFKLSTRNIKSLKCQLSYLILSKMAENNYKNDKIVKEIYQIYKSNLFYTLKTYKHFKKKFFIFHFIKARRWYSKLLKS